MKNIVKNIVWFTLLIVSPSAAQQFTDTIRHAVSLDPASPPTVILANINGSVRVSGVAGNELRLEAVRTISARTPDRLVEGKGEIAIDIIDRGDTVIVYITDPCQQFGRRLQRRGEKLHGWGYFRKENTSCRMAYDYQVDVVAYLPFKAHVLASTVNKGEVSIEEVRGAVRADNVNGNIRIQNLQNRAEARTINGDLDIRFLKNPVDDCEFYSLNGDIHAMFRPGLSADVTFESFNGGLYTNIAQVRKLPQLVAETGSKDGLRYKISGDKFRIGAGGPLLAFETFNGKVYLKEE